ncbi:MAG: cation-translocating P-type ATPase [Bacillota bacterium]|nr:cation-translocating P-type ATPase [Bacillota bacterium]
MLVKDAYLLDADEVLRRLGSGEAGLSGREAALRRQLYGENKLREAKPTPLYRRCAAQLNDPMVLILLAAAAVSAWFGEWADTLIIAVVVLLNACLGLYQEGKAARAAAALARLSAPMATLRRAGKTVRLPAAEIVPGDIVLLEAGDIVPADLRLLDAQQLRCDESSLTGESAPVGKDAAALAADAEQPLAARCNMAYAGSPVLCGRGTGVAAACGMDSELGHIAALLEQETALKTPLQGKMAELSRLLSLAVGAICALIFGLLLWQGGTDTPQQLLDALMLAISLAVAAIPEGLVVVVTLLLSLGMAAMSRRRAIVRRLMAVETLGAASVICSDKTGTLTENKMRVVAHSGGAELALAMTLCNDAQLSAGGDPTETALLAWAAEQGCDAALSRAAYPRAGELPFDSARKLMSTLHRAASGGVPALRQYTKGAPERILELSTHYLDDDGQRRPLTAGRREQVRRQHDEWARQALRLLAAAYRDGERLDERGLTYIGCAGIIDPPRAEAAAAIAEARAAGLTAVMISGDNPLTAAAIAAQVGIEAGEGQVMTGAELARLDDRQLAQAVKRCRVYARVAPDDKLRIVRAWQAAGAVTAMTGDGVNDAPALQAADIGVGMGISGSEVSKQVADVILADDNFATIVAAVREGRRIYDNIRKAIGFLLSSNLAEVLAIFAATMLGIRLFLPVHLLWINLITDCFPAIALGMEPPEPQTMRRPPRAARQSIFAGGMAADILYQGAAAAALTLLAYGAGAARGEAAAMSMAFVTLSAAEIFHSWNMRSRERSVFALEAGNPYLAAAMLLALALNMALLYIPPLAALFRLEPLPLPLLLLSLLLAFAMVPLVELVKRGKRGKQGAA